MIYKVSDPKSKNVLISDPLVDKESHCYINKLNKNKATTAVAQLLV